MRTCSYFGYPLLCHHHLQRIVNSTFEKHTALTKFIDLCLYSRSFNFNGWDRVSQLQFIYTQSTTNWQWKWQPVSGIFWLQMTFISYRTSMPNSVNTAKLEQVVWYMYYQYMYLWIVFGVLWSPPLLEYSMGFVHNFTLVNFCCCWKNELRYSETCLERSLFRLMSPSESMQS